MALSNLNPYLFKGFLDWMVDNEQTPYLLIDTSVKGVVVPDSYVQDHKIMLSLSPFAIADFSLLEHKITFNTKFKGKTFFIEIPYGSMIEIRAKESEVSIPLFVWFKDDVEDDEEGHETTFSISKDVGKKEDDTDSSAPSFSLVKD